MSGVWVSYLSVYLAREHSTATALSPPSTEKTKPGASAQTLRFILEGPALQRYPQQAMVIASSSLRDLGWFFPFSIQKSHLRGGGRWRGRNQMYQSWSV